MLYMTNNTSLGSNFSKGTHHIVIYGKAEETKVVNVQLYSAPVVKESSTATLADCGGQTAYRK